MIKFLLFSKTFIDEIEHFHRVIADFDRRIARIGNQAFTDCNGLEAIFKLLHVLGSFLERSAIRRDFSPNYPIILDLLEREMDEAKDIYDRQMDFLQAQGSIQLDRNMPKVSGSLMWAEELKQRYTQPMEQYRTMEIE